MHFAALCTAIILAGLSSVRGATIPPGTPTIAGSVALYERGLAPCFDPHDPHSCDEWRAHLKPRPSTILGPLRSVIGRRDEPMALYERGIISCFNPSDPHACDDFFAHANSPPSPITINGHTIPNPPINARRDGAEALYERAVAPCSANLPNDPHACDEFLAHAKPPPSAIAGIKIPFPLANSRRDGVEALYERGIIPCFNPSDPHACDDFFAHAKPPSGIFKNIPIFMRGV